MELGNGKTIFMDSTISKRIYSSCSILDFSPRNRTCRTGEADTISGTYDRKRGWKSCSGTLENFHSGAFEGVGEGEDINWDEIF